MAPDDRTRTWSWAASLAVVALTALLSGCESPVTREVQQACANAPDREACEDAEYNRRAAEERARFNYGRHYQ